jgi:hypothetical protein
LWKTFFFVSVRDNVSLYSAEAMKTLIARKFPPTFLYPAKSVDAAGVLIGLAIEF